MPPDAPGGGGTIGAGRRRLLRLLFPWLVPLAACIAANDELLERPRGDVRFESPRRLPLVVLGDLPAPPGSDARVADRGALRAVGRAEGDVLLLRTDREPDRAAARVEVGAPVRALAFGAGEASRHLYVALANGRLLTVDLEASGGPAVVDTIATRAALALAADRDRLVLLTDEARHRVLRFDLWNPARPRLDGSIESSTIDDASAVALHEGRLLLFAEGAPPRAYRLDDGSGTTTVHQSVNQ